MYFKHELKYLKRSGHVTGDVMPLFVHAKKSSGGTLLPCKFLLASDVTSSL